MNFMSRKVSQLTEHLDCFLAISRQAEGLGGFNPIKDPLKHQEITVRTADLISALSVLEGMDEKNLHKPPHQYGASVKHVVFICGIDLLAQRLDIAASRGEYAIGDNRALVNDFLVSVQVPIGFFKSIAVRCRRNDSGEAPFTTAELPLREV